MRTQLEIEKELQNTLTCEVKSASDYHELKLAASVHKRPWYDQAARAASQSYFRLKARRRNLEWVLADGIMKNIDAFWPEPTEPPLPSNWPNEPNERWSQCAQREQYLPWRQLVFEYNHSEVRAGCAPLTREAFYECCLQDSAFQARWTPYADLSNTPFGPISELDLDETAGPPIS